ncbi:MAG: uncharacterized protein QOG71_3622 [Pyrinomonadaceae bacterium]|nr:uncharacterized protein [Pyrinomonadaceae bacterium]
MNFEWDEQKNAANIHKHGFDFTDAWEMFESPMLTAPDTREDYGEERWVGIGFLRERAVVTVFTEPSDDVIRVISMRKALKHERIRLEETIRDQLDAR